MVRWQAEVRVNLDAIRDNVSRLCASTNAAVMAVVKGDGYRHGMVESARAALSGGATWLGVTTLDEALALRRAGITAPVLAWLLSPGLPLREGIDASIDFGVATVAQLDEMIKAGAEAGKPVHVHLKVDTGLSRGGATMMDWPLLVHAAAQAEARGTVRVAGVWSHLAAADDPGHETIDAQLDAFREALSIAARHGVHPSLRHIANSAATLTRPDAHFDMVRAGIAIYGLSPVPGERFGLRPAMTARAKVMLSKRIPAGTGVSYAHTYTTTGETTVAVIPLGYADGVPRHASNVGPVRLNGRTHTIAGRVCMDQVVVDVGDLPVSPGDVATLFGPGDDGEPTADDWAAAADTTNYEIVTRFGSARTRRVYEGSTLDQDPPIAPS
ncbi:alanine racemase [Asanoa iriomotensis]|uniref:Alanine racemase n=1 Tax=Asanoa iriomotensis TaxID=234613 RepID=A0ABQ4C3U3_9ACTN|nr:alanine racemase [Asanoa iriomotensis]GIF57468.1 alanine racemase [Asanoa iriomotensis]